MAGGNYDYKLLDTLNRIANSLEKISECISNNESVDEFTRLQNERSRLEAEKLAAELNSAWGRPGGGNW